MTAKESDEERKKRAFTLNNRIEQFPLNPLRSTGLARLRPPAVVSSAAKPFVVALCALVFGELYLTLQLSCAASAPVIEPLRDVYLSEGQVASVSVRATDADGDPLSLTATQRPAGASLVDHGDGTASFLWSSEYIGPLSSAGSPFTVMFVASDGVAQSLQSMRIFVQNVNRSPIVSAPDSVFVEVGDTIAIQPTVFDPDRDRINWSATGSPPGARLRNAGGPGPVTLEWAPEKADRGSHTITLTATDEWGLSASASATVIVSIGPAFTVTVATDTVFPGEIVSLPVSLKNREPISGFEFELHYDPSVMTFISASADSARVSSFESFTYLSGSPAPGDLKLSAVADIPDSITTAPLAAGDGPLFFASFFVSSQNNLAGLFLPVGFRFGPLGSTTTNILTDSLGDTIVSDSIVFVNGGVKIENQSAINRGDINLNGVPFEVGDALRFTNYFIDPVTFGFNAQQFANSDINGDGIVASVADLVALLSIVVGDGSANPKVIPGGDAPVTVLFERNPTEAVTRFVGANGRVTVGAALLIFAAHSRTNPQTFAIDTDALPEGFEAKLHQDGDTIRALVYNTAPGGVLRGLSDVRFQSASNRTDFEALQLVGVELASAQGETLQTELSGAATASSEAAFLPETFALEQNYPNPFNPETEIHYSLPTRASVKLVIYDILGRTVRTLARGTAEAGEYVARWNGSDEAGSKVASGMYFYRLTVNGQTLSRKMTLLK